MKNIWLVVGKEVDGNEVKKYMLLSDSGNRQSLTKNQLIRFCKSNEVVNIQTAGDNITGKGISLNSIARYKRSNQFGLDFIGGLSEQQVISAAQPYIQQLRESEARKQREQLNKLNNNNSSKLETIRKKLFMYNNILNEASKMKDLTNLYASDSRLTRYLKQIDIENTDDESLSKMIERQGVNGLAKEIRNRIHKVNKRATEYKLTDSLMQENNGVTVKQAINQLLSKCDEIEKLHAETKKIIKDNKNNDVEITQEEIDSGDAVEIPIQSKQQEIKYREETVQEQFDAIEDLVHELEHLDLDPYIRSLDDKIEDGNVYAMSVETIIIMLDIERCNIISKYKGGFDIESDYISKDILDMTDYNKIGMSDDYAIDVMHILVEALEEFSELLDRYVIDIDSAFDDKKQALSKIYKKYENQIDYSNDPGMTYTKNFWGIGGEAVETMKEFQQKCLEAIEENGNLADYNIATSAYDATEEHLKTLSSEYILEGLAMYDDI